MSILQNEKLLRTKIACRDIVRVLSDIITRSILLVAGVAVLNLVVLYFYNILWHIYRLTYIGRQFVILHPETTRMISNVLGKDIFDLSIHTTLAAFVICMLFGSVCQMFYFYRFFYQPQGFIRKFIMWGLMLTVVVSIYINGQHGFKSWTAVIPITIVPTLGVFTYCFDFSARIWPEIGDVIRALILFTKWMISVFVPAKKPADAILTTEAPAGQPTITVDSVEAGNAVPQGQNCSELSVAVKGRIETES